MGGTGALVAAATFLIGLALYGTLLLDYTTADTPAEAVAFLLDHTVPLRIWNLVVTVVFAVAMVPLALALRDRCAADRATAQIGGIFGIIWAGLLLATGMITNVGITAVVDLAATDPDRATTLWASLDAVQRGLGGGNEVVGGIWVLLISTAAWRTGALGRVTNVLGLMAGAAGLLTVVPALMDVGTVFGLGLLVWYILVGVQLRRPSVLAPSEPLSADAPAPDTRAPGAAV